MSGPQGSAGGQASAFARQLTTRLSLAELLIAGGAALELVVEVIGLLPGMAALGGWPRALSIALLALVFMRRWRGMAFSQGWYDYLLIFLGVVCGFFGAQGLLGDLGAGLGRTGLAVVLELIADVALIVIGIGGLLTAWRGTGRPATTA